MGRFSQFIRDAQLEARASKQIASVAHVFLRALGALLQDYPANRTLRSCAVRIEGEILPSLALDRVDPANLETTFDRNRLAALLDAHVAEVGSSGGLHCDALFALVALETQVERGGNPAETSWGRARQVCIDNQLAARLRRGLSGDDTDIAVCEQITLPWLYCRTVAPLVGRDAEIRRAMALLNGTISAGWPLLITGVQSVGKTHFLWHLLHRFLQFTEEPGGLRLHGRAFVNVPVAAFRGNGKDVRNRLEELLDFLNEQHNTIPVFDQFECFIDSAMPISHAFSEILGGFVGAGNRPIVFVSSELSERSVLLRDVQRIVLRPLEPGESHELLVRRMQTLLGEDPDTPLRVENDDLPGLVTSLIETAAEYYPGQPFPALGLSLLRRFCTWRRAMILFDGDAPGHEGTVSAEHLTTFIAQDLGLETLDTDFTLLAEELKQEVIGQDHAVDAICRGLQAGSRCKSQRYPKGRFLFVGPPGVGKTHLARRLAEALLGKTAFFRYNMSDFASEGDRWRFIGSARGYQGSEKRTIFDDVRENPTCVILLDEIDRANQAIQDILLSMLEGEAQDGDNRTVYFSQAIFVMTTNLCQEAVCAEYEGARAAAGFPRTYTHQELLSFIESGAASEETRLRASLAAMAEHQSETPGSLTSSSLRTVLLEGGRDESEQEMRRILDDRIDRVRRGEGGVEGEFGGDAEVARVGAFLQLRELRERLTALSFQRSRIDRAFLDRIDFILPFLPIKEPDLVARIMALKLREFGWETCPIETQCSVLARALVEKESVRPLERLVREAMSQDTPGEDGSMDVN